MTGLSLAGAEAGLAAGALGVSALAITLGVSLTTDFGVSLTTGLAISLTTDLEKITEFIERVKDGI